MIDKQTIAKINDAARIEEVVSDFVTLRRRGANLIGLCPFHNEKTGSFNVNPARNIFKCFGCGEGGSPVHFIMKHEQLSYPDALKYLAKKYNIPVQERELTDDEKIQQNDRENLLIINDFAAKYFAQNLVNNPQGNAVGKGYFYERGFSDATIAQFNLGYSLEEYTAFVTEAKKKSFKDDYLLQLGLAARRDDGSLYDKYRGRVMFPIHSISGKIVGFGGRVLKKDEKTAKYINSPESEIYHKSNELYGIYFAKNEIVKQDRCFLVEGYTDVISMYQSGVKNVVSSSGTSLTEGQIRLIKRFTPNITVIYDGDNAGIKASIRGIDMLLKEGMNVKTVLLPSGEDPDSFAQKNNADDFIKFINENQTDFIQFKINILQEDAKNDPVKKAALIGDVINSIFLIEERIKVDEYAKKLAFGFDISIETIYNNLRKLEIEKKKADFKKIENQRNDEPPPPPIPPENFDEENDPRILHELEKQQSPYKQQERELLYFLIRYGQIPLVQANNEKGFLTAGEYIISELKTNDLKVSFPLYIKIFNEFSQKIDEQNFNVENYFTNHQNIEISHFTADILADKHIISKYFTKHEVIKIPELPELDENDEKSIRYYNLSFLAREKMLDLQKEKENKKNERLYIDINRVLIEYFDAIILTKLKITQRNLSNAAKIGDKENFYKLQKEFSDLTEKKIKISKKLGSRVIVKIK